MRLDNHKHNNVKSSGNIGGESSFTIAVNPKMFRVLSDTMYEDKIGSIVRELSSNALDGHRKAGHPDTPFTIHLPNALEPWFSVKDTGVGLSDDDIRNVYTTYGLSTKDQSDDEVGAFGFGCKTPFAYTDNFTVSSTYEGVQRTYVAVINEKGLPVINLQDERDTSAVNGVEVTIAVNGEDFDDFQRAIVKQLRFFDVKPELVNNIRGLKFDDMNIEENITVDSDEVRIYKYANAPFEGLWVIQGGVGYPINLERLGDIDDSISKFANMLENENSYMVFNIGEISVTANREGISYEAETIKAVVDRIKLVARTITEKAVKEIKTNKFLWDRIVSYNGQMVMIQTALRQLPEFATLFPDTSLKSGYMSIDEAILEKSGFKAVHLERHSYYKRGSYSATDYKIKRVTIGADEPNGWGRSANTYLRPLKNTVLLLKDTNKKPLARVAAYIEENKFQDTVIFESLEIDEKDITEKDIKKFAKIVGINPAILKRTTTLPEPVTIYKNGSTKGGKRARAYRFKGVENTHDSAEWEVIYDDLNDLGKQAYIGMDRHSIDNAGHNGFLAVTAAISYGLGNFNGITLIAVNQQTLARIQAGKTGKDLVPWTELVDDATASLKTINTACNGIRVKKEFIKTIEDDTLLGKLVEHGVDVPVLSKIKTIVKRVESLKNRLDNPDWFNNYQNRNTIRRALGDINVTDGEAGTETAKARINTFYAQYPLLQHIKVNWQNEEQHDAIIIYALDYIKMIDGA